MTAIVCEQPGIDFTPRPAQPRAAIATVAGSKMGRNAQIVVLMLSSTSKSGERPRHQRHQMPLYQRATPQMSGQGHVMPYQMRRALAGLQPTAGRRNRISPDATITRGQRGRFGPGCYPSVTPKRRACMLV